MHSASLEKDDAYLEFITDEEIEKWRQIHDDITGRPVDHREHGWDDGTWEIQHATSLLIDAIAYPNFVSG